MKTIFSMNAELREQGEQSTIAGLEQQIAASRAAHAQAEARIIDLEAECQNHVEHLAPFRGRAEKAEARLDALKLKLEAAKEALSFYAGCPALTSHDAASYDSGSFENDKGQRAREALSQLNAP